MPTHPDSLTAQQRDAILHHVQDAVIATDAEGFVLYMNEAATHLYGFGERVGTERESLNLQRYALDTFEVRTLAGDAVPEEDQPLTRALRGESYDNVELLVRHRDLDETRVFVFSGRVLGTDQGLRVLTIRDETDRWRAERRYRTAFETDPAPSFVARLEDERILQANLGMQEMLGADKAAIVGKTLSEIELLSASQDVPDSLGALRAGERIHKHKTTVRHPDGGVALEVLVSARAIEIEGAPCGIFTFIDVTDLERSRREHLRAKEDLTRAMSRLANQREAERARVARELHDGVVQDLLALGARLANEERAQRRDGHVEAAEVSRRSREHVLDAVVELRGALRGLRPPPVRELGLWVSLRETLPDLDLPGEPDLVLPEGAGPDLPDETLVVLHQVAQEAVRNALKHADASEVKVTFEAAEGDAVLQVHDDGRGFEVPERLSTLERHDRFGLVGMEERVAAHGGRLEIESAPGEGTTVRCRIPLEP